MPYIGNSPGTGTRNRFIYTATASQTTFTGADDNGKTLKYADSDYVDVYLNGICLVPVTDYTSTSKTSIVLTQAASLNDTLEVIAYDIATIADTVSKADGGTFEGNVNFTEDARFGSGNTSSVSVGNGTGAIQVADTTSTALTAMRYVSSSAGPFIMMGKTRSATVGTVGSVVSDGDDLGTIRFAGDDGTDVDSVAATIRAEVDGTPGSNDMPGRLLFETTADGASSSTERMRINSDGQVLVGSTSTSFSNSVATFATSDTNTSVANGAGAAISIKNKDTTDGNYSTLYFENSAGGIDSAIYGVHGDADGTGTSRVGTLAFATANSGGGVAERMRIDSNGDVLLGTASALDTSDPGTTITGPQIKPTIGSTSNFQSIQFRNPNGKVGTIAVSGSSTSYNTSSDYRLKENVSDISDGITRVKQLSPKRFNFIADADTTVDGFLAHEAATVVPESVSGAKDAVQVWVEGEELPDGVSVGDNKLDDDGNTMIEPQAIDQSKLVPLLTAALQEAIAKIETLETKVAALEAE